MSHAFKRPMVYHQRELNIYEILNRERYEERESVGCHVSPRPKLNEVEGDTSFRGVRSRHSRTA